MYKDYLRDFSGHMSQLQQSEILIILYLLTSNQVVLSNLLCTGEVGLGDQMYSFLLRAQFRFWRDREQFQSGLKGPAYTVGLMVCDNIKKKGKACMFMVIFLVECRCGRQVLCEGLAPLENHDLDCVIRCVGLGSTSPSAKCYVMASCMWERPWHRS